MPTQSDPAPNFWLAIQHYETPRQVPPAKRPSLCQAHGGAVRVWVDGTGESNRLFAEDGGIVRPGAAAAARYSRSFNWRLISSANVLKS